VNEEMFLLCNRVQRTWSRPKACREVYSVGEADRQSDRQKDRLLDGEDIIIGLEKQTDRVIDG